MASGPLEDTYETHNVHEEGRVGRFQDSTFWETGKLLSEAATPSDRPTSTVLKVWISLQPLSTSSFFKK